MMETLAFKIGQAVGLIAIFTIFALLIKIASDMRNKNRDGKIAPKIEEKTEPSHITEMNSKLDNAGVETERDLL